MGLPLIDDFLSGESKEIHDLANNEAVLVGFLTLAKSIDDLPGVDPRFYEEPRSLYKVTSSGCAIETLIDILSEFFDKPEKAPGEGLPVDLRFDPVVKHLGGVRKDQALFLKRLKTGAFYGALWPWQKDADKIEVLLGFHSASMSSTDYSRLENLVKKFLSQRKIESMSSVGGQIHGISLPSFLQMSEMEGASYTLKVISNSSIGYLYLDDGNLIAAQYQEQTGATAAHRIISWDNPAIQIEPADHQREREIHEPLMHVMMESLKIKDESGAETEPFLPDSQEPEENASIPTPPPFLPPGLDEAARYTTGPQQAAQMPVSQDSPADAADSSLPPPVTPGAISGKAADRSVGRQDRMAKKKGRFLIALAVVLIIAIGGIGGGVFMKKSRLNQQYDRLQADLAATQELDARIVLIMKYLRSHPGDPHQIELETRLSDLNTEIEERDYEQTVSAVNKLPIDDQYEQRALSLYTAFLSKYPQSPYANRVNDAMDGVRGLLGTAYFRDLDKVATAGFIERYNAYRTYLDKFPDSHEGEAVERMIDDLTREYLAAVESGIPACDARKNWDDCMAQCDRFLSIFPSGADAEKIVVLRSMLQDKKDMVSLDDQAQSAGNDLAKALKIYTVYLESHPDTTQKKVIDQRIRQLETGLAKVDAWSRTAAFAGNPKNDIFERMKKLDEFLKNQHSGPYADSARELQEQLGPELQAAIRSRHAKTQQRKALAVQQAEQDRLAMEAQRVKRLQSQVVRQLQPVSDRFVGKSDGTVTDRMTGLTWALLDSHMDLDQCISYRSAKAYIQELDLGGHSDWRLPTAGELASIYKNRPFFPGTGAAWYWTSESFARGYHRVVDVVTSAPETVFARVSKSEDRCGAVRAVRR